MLSPPLTSKRIQDPKRNVTRIKICDGSVVSLVDQKGIKDNSMPAIEEHTPEKQISNLSQNGLTPVPVSLIATESVP